jgi:hypothetical protein
MKNSPERGATNTHTMKALLKTYTLDTLTQTEIVEVPDNYDGNPYGDTVPFCVGSNQSLEVLES